MKKFTLVLLSCILVSSHLYSQNYPRDYNLNYVYTVFYDDFNDSIIDLTKWNPNNGDTLEGDYLFMTP